MNKAELDNLTQLLEEERERLDAKEVPPMDRLNWLVLILVAVFFYWMFTP